MMIPTQIQNNIVRIETPAVYAYYIVHSSVLYPLALVCDNDDILIGIISVTEIDPLRVDITKSCGQICNRNFRYIADNNSEDTLYEKARSIFAEANITTLPVIDENGVPIRLFGKFQAFFLDMYKMLPYYQYAHCLMESARRAKAYGYDRISAIEFGVAGGNGLIHLGIYAREIQRLVKIGIDVYGFDFGGEGGLQSPNGYRDCPEYWIANDYKMDFERLMNRLYSEKLVIGDICKTTTTFLTDYNPAPIGFISVDVDQYTPTVAILNMLLQDDKFFIPIISMYFDDIGDDLEFQGESLAIKDFNTKNKNIKITPEKPGLNFNWIDLPVKETYKVALMLSRIKWCKRFNHPRYSTTRTQNSNLFLRNC